MFPPEISPKFWEALGKNDFEKHGLYTKKQKQSFLIEIIWFEKHGTIIAGVFLIIIDSNHSETNFPRFQVSLGFPWFQLSSEKKHRKKPEVWSITMD